MGSFATCIGIENKKRSCRYGVQEGVSGEERDKSGRGTKGSLRFPRNPHSEVLVVE